MYTTKAWKAIILLLGLQLWAGSAMAQAPANDECGGAITLIPASGATCTATVTGSELNATMSAHTPSCSFGASNDVWYSFTATATTHKIQLSNVHTNNPDVFNYYYFLTIYSGNCTGLAEMACSSFYKPASSPSAGNLAISGLSIGQTYYIQVAGGNGYDINYNAVSNMIAFEVCVSTPPPPPANDACNGAITLVPSNDLACTAPVAGSTLNATTSYPTPSCYFGVANDVWYSFTATATTHRVQLSNVLPNNPNAFYYDYFLTVYSGNCGSLTEMACDNAQEPGSAPSSKNLTAGGLTIGQTYYIRVTSGAGYDNNFYWIENNIGFEVCVGMAPPPPANDECAGAIPVMGANTVITGDNTDATSSMPQNSCSSSSQPNDVWFTFTPAATGDMIIDINELNVDAVAEIFSGSCGALSSIDCIDYGFPWTVPVTANTTYYLRVYDYFGDGAGTFDITFGGTVLPVTGGKLSGTTRNGRAFLTWSTFTEQNNKGFVVQRSADGKDFHNAGWVKSNAAQGNSTQALNYVFSDPEALVATAYYRLQQTDIDGRTTTSNTIQLAPGNAASFMLTAAPNPVKDRLMIMIQGEQKPGASLSVIDLTGKTLKTQPVTGSETAVDMSALPGGLYFARYQDDSRCQTIKISKQ